MKDDFMVDKFDYISFSADAIHEFRNGGGEALYAAVALSRLKAGVPSITKVVRRHAADRDGAIADCLAYLQERGYVPGVSPNGFDFAVRDSGSGYADAFAVFRGRSNTIVLELYGDPDEVRLIAGWVERNMAAIGFLIKTATGINPNNGRVEFQSNYVVNADARIAKASFYPWLTVPLEDYFKAFMQSDETVLVMFGPPGTGKSTFLRSLIHSGSYETYLAYDQKVVESPEVIQSFYNGHGKILAYEDIDKHMQRREAGNGLMATILNAADGVVQEPGKKKIIFSTNLPTIDSIDPALLRVGRCFDIMEFKELTRDQAAAVLDDLGREPQDFSAKPFWSLAQVLSKGNPARQVINRFARKVGFG